ncbi:hypothetical protein BBP40_011608 [Aspergillus hancockii]|nr:hypothetical protein BBP40_011608 [Aspergillus hancockii]
MSLQSPFVNPMDLTESLGTVLENVQLSQLSEKQLEELALLVTERDGVFFRGQDLTMEKQGTWTSILRGRIKN